MKESFVEYVRALDDGQVNVAGGARGGEHGFVFPAAMRAVRLTDEEPQDEAPVLRFQGSVSFRGHGHLLRVDINDPWLERDGEAGLLSVAGPRPGTARVAVAHLNKLRVEQSEEGLRWLCDEPTLTFHGTYWLGAHYDEGTVLSPLIAQGGFASPVSPSKG